MVKNIYILKFFLFLYQNTVIKEIKRERKVPKLDQTSCRCGDVALQVSCEKAISS